MQQCTVLPHLLNK